MLKSISESIRNLTLNCVGNLVRILSRIELKLSLKENPNPNGFEDLTPTSEGNEDKKYTKVIEWALKNENIKNIALTGPYGSGKSSIIKAFINENKGYNFLNISLASFSDKDIIGKEDEINRLLELSILQQMFYHVKNKTIPDSRFQRIKNLSVFDLITKSFFFVFWVIASLIFLKPKFITDSFLWKKIELNNDGTVEFITAILFILGITFIVSKVIRIANNSKLNKLNIQSGEIEIDNKIDSSILNKHLDEILYFFEVTKFDIVILEDLDRFENTEIFTKLRELNILINHSKQINKRIVFLYAIKDDMFIDKNRTKFFDFIIPVIPIINTSNSGEMFLNKLKEAGFVDNIEIKDSLSLDFISDVSMYIDDMRLLKNIYNEYVIYKTKLDPKLVQNNLLAIIIFKNIFPSDFVDLHNNKGQVHTVFNKKNELIKSITVKINSDIKSTREEIQLLENVTVNDIMELRAIYIEKIIEKIPNISSLHINGTNTTFENCKVDVNFKFLQQNSYISYYQYYANNYNQLAVKQAQSTIKFEEIENAVDSVLLYKEREKLITEKNSDKIEKLKLKIEQLVKEKNEIKTCSLYQIAEKFGLTEFFKDIEIDKLIIYLIRNGYLNENYHDYISYFYEGIITKEDRDFIFSIKNREALDFRFKLTKTENLIKKIQIKEFEYKESLNLWLLDFLLINNTSFPEQYNLFFSQICNKSRSSMLFIDCYIAEGLNVELFVIELHAKWTTFWQHLILESGFSDQKKDIYLKVLITYLNIEDLLLQNVNNILSNYISNKNDFISFVSEFDEERVKIILDGLDIQYIKLNEPTSENKLFDYIYEHNHYQINIYMINLFLIQKGKIEDAKLIENANYTTITSSNCMTLKKYINENIQDYMTNVFLKLKNNNLESEESIIILLNNENIAFDNRLEIIDLSENLITSLSLIKNNDLANYLISNNKIKATWNNVVHYYSLFEDIIDEDLILFLNEEENYLELSKSKMENVFGNDNQLSTKFSKDFIINVAITDNCFEELLRCFQYVYSPLDFKDLSARKIELMIKNGYLQLSKDRYNYLKENFAGKHISLLERYPQKFLENQVEYSFDENDLISLLSSKTYNIEQKVNLIIESEIDIIMKSSKLCNSVSAILSNYKYVELDTELLRSIILKSQSVENKIKLLNINFQYLSKSIISDLLICLGEPYSDISVKGKKPSIPKNNSTLVLAENLDRIDFISSFKVKEHQIKINTKRP